MLKVQSTLIYGSIEMKNINLKPVVISFFLLFTVQISAQESDRTNTEESGDPESCNPFPDCVEDYFVTSEEAEITSKWSLLWEKISKEMKETVDNLPLPKTPE
ncbi:MAG: hypothetical protein ABJI92_10470 [Kangiellaceae bacterium]|jgi:hypothetical protein